MSHNTMTPAEEREYADVIIELRQQALYARQKHANEHWHRVAERLASAFGAGDPDAARAVKQRQPGGLPHGAR